MSCILKYTRKILAQDMSNVAEEDITDEEMPILIPAEPMTWKQWNLLHPISSEPTYCMACQEWTVMGVRHSRVERHKIHIRRFAWRFYKVTHFLQTLHKLTRLPHTPK